MNKPKDYNYDQYEKLLKAHPEFIGEKWQRVNTGSSWRIIQTDKEIRLQCGGQGYSDGPDEIRAETIMTESSCESTDNSWYEEYERNALTIAEDAIESILWFNWGESLRIFMDSNLLADAMEYEREQAALNQIEWARQALKNARKIIKDSKKEKNK